MGAPDSAASVVSNRGEAVQITWMNYLNYFCALVRGISHCQVTERIGQPPGSLLLIENRMF